MTAGLIGAPDASALQCVLIRSADEATKFSDTVFEGRVLSSDRLTPEPGPPRGKDLEDLVNASSRFEVARYLKGSGPERVTVSQIPVGGAPRVPPKAGQVWRVYANGDPGQLGFNPCVPLNRPLHGPAADRIEAEIDGPEGASASGQSRGDETTAPGPGDPGGVPGIVVLIGAAGLGGLFAAVLLARRRQRPRASSRRRS